MSADTRNPVLVVGLGRFGGSVARIVASKSLASTLLLLVEVSARRVAIYQARGPIARVV